MAGGIIALAPPPAASSADRGGAEEKNAEKAQRIGTVHTFPAHESPEQQPSDAHDCPICEQPIPPPSVPPDVVPPSLPGGGGRGEQLPCVAPGGTTHVIPEQQSAVDVHAPADGMHAVAAHTSCPLEFGTHGWPLQQSAAVAHVFPVWRHASVPPSERPYARQRGTPSLSSKQARNFGV